MCSYVRQAGGFSHNARGRKTYAIYQNGKVATVRYNRIKTEPGMELVVPEKEETERRAISVAEIASLVTSSSSLAYLIYAVSTMLRK